MFRVAIFGQMNNGKTTFAKFLVSHLNDRIRMNMDELKMRYVFQLDAFATAVKDSVSSKFAVPLSDIEFWKNDIRNYPGWTCTMREALQREGEQARQIDPRVWIRKVMNNPFPTILQDGRYENEAHAIYESKGYNILIVRPDFINDCSHPSEAFIGSLIKSIGVCDHNKDKGTANPTLRYFNHLILNNGDLDNIEQSASNTADIILSRMQNNE